MPRIHCIHRMDGVLYLTFICLSIVACLFVIMLLASHSTVLQNAQLQLVKVVGLIAKTMFSNITKA